MPIGIKWVVSGDIYIWCDTHNAFAIMRPSNEASDACAVPTDFIAVTTSPNDVVAKVGIGGEAAIDDADDRVTAIALDLSDRRGPVNRSHPVINLINAGIGSQAVVPIEEERRTRTFRHQCERIPVVGIDPVTGKHFVRETFFEGFAGFCGVRITKLSL